MVGVRPERARSSCAYRVGMAEIESGSGQEIAHLLVGIKQILDEMQADLQSIREIATTLRLDERLDEISNALSELAER